MGHRRQRNSERQDRLYRIYIQDAMATCLDLGGVEKPSHVEFESVLPLVKGDSSKARKAMYSCYTHHQRMIVKDGVKYIFYPVVGEERLFDLNKDPMEEKNLAADPAMKSKKDALKTELLGLMKEMNDPLDPADPVGSFKKAFPKGEKGGKKKKKK